MAFCWRPESGRMIGAVGSLISREAHPLRALSLPGFYVAVALQVILWASWHINSKTPFIKVTGFR